MQSEAERGKQAAVATATTGSVQPEALPEPYPVTSRQRLIQNALLDFQSRIQERQRATIEDALRAAGEARLTGAELRHIEKTLIEDPQRLPFDFGEERMPF